MADDNAVSASAKGATFMVLLQVTSRALTFALNQILLRFLSPQLLGVAVQLELFIISTLYFSRESLRIATQRRSDGGVQAAINLSYLCTAAGIPIGAALAQMYLWKGTMPDVKYLETALRINQLTAAVELIGEPGFVAVQQCMLYKTRAAAEATAVIMKTLATAGLVFWGQYQGYDLGVLPFTAGEFAYSTALTVVYLSQTATVARLKDFTLWPKKMASSPSHQYIFSLFSQPLLYLSASLYLQTGVKWLLTEGDKILIGMFATLEDQGMYALSANYGGLIARMLFRPIEDSSRNLFAKLCAAPQPDPSNEKSAPSANGNTITASSEKRATEQLTSYRQASSILSLLLRTYALLSLFALTFGPSVAPLLLRLVAGPKWSSSGAGEVLATYSYCIPLLALNGVSEAFVSATASTIELRRQSLWMTGFSVAFAGSAYVFLRVLGWGAKGLVGANCVNMALRVGFNLWYARRYFEEQGVKFDAREVLPTAGSVGAVAVAVAGLRSVKGMLGGRMGVIGEVAEVGVIGVAFLGVIVAAERQFLMDCYRRFVGQR